MPLSGIAVAEISIGGILVYSGMKGAPISDTIKSFLNGQTPTNVQQITSGNATLTADTTSTTTTPTGNAPSVKGAYSTADLEALWKSQGGDSNTAAFAAAVAMAESSGSATVTSSNPDGGTNVGLWQLDTKGVGSGFTVAELQDPKTNAQITVLATNNGQNWSDWGDPVAAAVGYHYTPGSAVP